MTYHDPDDLCGAWQAVMEEMPEGWYFRSLQNLTVEPHGASQKAAVSKHGPHWRAVANRRHDMGFPKTSGMTALAPTAAGALWRLADYLTKVGHGGRWAPTFGDATFAP